MSIPSVQSTRSHHRWIVKWLIGSLWVPLVWFIVYPQWAATRLPTGGFSSYDMGSFYSSAVFLLGLWMIHYGFYVIATVIAGNATPREKMVHYLIWTLWPPLFFFSEWFYFYPRYGLPTSEALEG